MNAKVVVTDYTFPDLARETAAAEGAGAAFAAYQCKTDDEVVAAVAGADVAVVQFAPFSARAIAALAPGAAIIRYGIGYDNIDVAAARAGGHPVGYVPDYCPDEVADHTAASLLAMLRKLPALDASVRAGDWKAVAVASPIKPFSETMVGFFGFGQIARGVHARLRPFGFRFAAADPMADRGKLTSEGIELMTPEALFAAADAITLHAPATPETTGYVDAARLATMQANAVIVNTARGALIDEAALAQALADGSIGGAALDVFDTEPLPGTSPLRDTPNLMLTPHAAWYSDAAIGRLQGLVAEDIANHLSGKALRKPVPEQD